MIVALDVGGTSMKGAVFTRALERVATLRRPTPHGEPAVEAIIGSVEELVAEAGTARAVGVALPGIVDDRRGVAVDSENVGWHDVPFRALIEERTRLPVVVGHDVRAGGVAEMRMGAARGVPNAMIMPIGTGISAAIVVDGHLCVGGGYAGEIGHLPVGSDEPCVCGGRGCLEAVASAAAVARRYARRTGRETSTETIAALVREGDPDAVAVWPVGYLATALTVAVALVAPEVIVIGGGLSRAGDLLIAPLREELAARLTFHRRPRITTARFGDEAGAVGAALWARDLLERS